MPDSVNWKKAKCLGLTDLMYAQDLTEGKRLCLGCSLIEPCLDTALGYSQDEDYGVWGGTGPKERRMIRRLRRA